MKNDNSPPVIVDSKTDGAKPKSLQWLYALGLLVMTTLAILASILGPFISSTIVPLVDRFAPGAGFFSRALMLLVALAIVPLLAGMLAEIVMRAFRGYGQFELLRRMRSKLFQKEGPGFALPHSAAMLNWPNDDLRTVVLVTGTVEDSKTGMALATVFIPNVPNPTSGALRVARVRDLTPLSWTTEQVLDYCISFGSLAPVNQQGAPHVLDGVT